MLLVEFTQFWAVWSMTLLLFGTVRCARMGECQQVAFNLTSTCLDSHAAFDAAQGCLESCRDHFDHLFQIIGHGSQGRFRPVNSKGQRLGSSQRSNDFENRPSIRNRLWAAIFHFEPCLARRYMCLNNIEGQIMSSVPPRVHVCERASCLDSSSPSAIGAQRCSCKATFRLERAYISWRKPMEFGPFRCDTESICTRINHLLTSKFSCVDHTVIETNIACKGHIENRCPCNVNGKGACTQIGWPSPDSQPDPMKILRQLQDDPPEGFDDTMESYNRYLCLMTPAWALHRLDSILANQIFGCDVGQADRFKRKRLDTAAGTSTISSDPNLQHAQTVEGVDGSSETCFTSQPPIYQSTDILSLATAFVPDQSPVFGNIDFGLIESNELIQLQHGQQPAIVDLGVAVLGDHTRPQALQSDVSSAVGMEWPPKISPMCPWPSTLYSMQPLADGQLHPTFQWGSNEATSSDTILDWRQELQLQSAQPISSLAPVNRYTSTFQVTHMDDLLNSNTVEQRRFAANETHSSTDIFEKLSAIFSPQRPLTTPPIKVDSKAADDDADDQLLSEEIAAQLLGFL